MEAYEKKRYIKTYRFRKAKSTGKDHSGVGSLNRKGDRTEFQCNSQIACSMYDDQKIEQELLKQTSEQCNKKPRP
jgi:hypothetical protein